MSRWSEREIARKLAERDELEPPPGLLEKIKSEIPPMIPIGTGVPEIDRRPSMPPRQRWLLAASLAAMIGAGLFALHLRMEVPPVKETARTAAGAWRAEKPAAVPSPPPSSPVAPQPEVRAFAGRQREPEQEPKPLSRKDEEKHKSLGYAGSVEGTVSGGTAGGVVGGVAAPQPAPPPPVSAPAPATVMPEAQVRADKKEAAAEAPLQDERRTERDRINVGGNESGQMSQDAGPGAANRPQPALAPRALAKTADSEIVWTSPAPFLVPLKPDTGTASYDVVRRAIVAGKLPDPGEIRVGEILNAFDTGAAPPVEGASTPFVHGPQYRVVRFNTSGISPERVTFNPALVVRCRQIGSGVSTLYEVELRSGVSRTDEAVAMLGLGDGAKGMTLPQLASSWDKASPGFRLAALAAEFAEILKGSPVDSAALHRLSKEIARLPKGPKAAELGELVERAGRIRGERGQG